MDEKSCMLNWETKTFVTRPINERHNPESVKVTTGLTRSTVRFWAAIVPKINYFKVVRLDGTIDSAYY